MGCDQAFGSELRSGDIVEVEVGDDLGELVRALIVVGCCCVGFDVDGDVGDAVGIDAHERVACELWRQATEEGKAQPRVRRGIDGRGFDLLALEGGGQARYSSLEAAFG